MTTYTQNGGGKKARVSSGFSLVEVMVVVSLLSVIVIGLMAMFNQTQRAFRLGMSQTDVLEAGRMATDMISRELEQVSPSHLPDGHYNATAFFVRTINQTVPPSPYEQSTLMQRLSGGETYRTNLLQDLFFVTRENNMWRGIGYFVRVDGGYNREWGPAGTLYRFEATNTAAGFENGDLPFLSRYWNVVLPGSTNLSKVLDGVVHFRIRVYDTNGIWIRPDALNVAPLIRDRTTFSPAAPGEVDLYRGDQFAFTSNAVPAFVELELGILEQEAYARYKAIPVRDAQVDFLKSQAGRVHIFRQRVAIRNVDPSAYQ